jgi:hypothetical protein
MKTLDLGAEARTDGLIRIRQPEKVSSTEWSAMNDLERFNAAMAEIERAHARDARNAYRARARARRARNA